MTNLILISKAVTTLEEIYESKNIQESRKSIESRILDWYNHTDLAEEEMLVAAAWIGDYSPSISFEAIVDAREALFVEPLIPREFRGLSHGDIAFALVDRFYK